MALFETLEMAGEYALNIRAKVTVVFGPDLSTGHEEITDMEGHVVIREWPTEGYELRTLQDGREQFVFEFLRAEMKGHSTHLDQTMFIRENSEAGNFGTVTSERSEAPLPATFEQERNIFVDSDLGRVKNAEPLVVRGVLNRIPPIPEPGEVSADMNVFHVTNAPVPLIHQETGETVGFFMGCDVYAESLAT